ncbi:MAG: putative 2OG-Fe(II) oxygenase [Gammaproteobacteria bacterium]|nr:putative 2OG-Fe(II) oxygenase [Gammaproteobacteria bacterium]
MVILRLPRWREWNPSLVRAFWRQTAASTTRRSHFIEGRYENIYPDLDRLPEADDLLAEIRRHAMAMLKAGGLQGLSMKVWFNVMAPGDATLPHRHDMDDERLSGVYYLTVPRASGDLVVATPAGRRVLTPLPGLLVLFPPHWEHEVTPHRGHGIRLSMAFNVGLRDP